jgi:AraC-like DNA-binding protein
MGDSAPLAAIRAEISAFTLRARRTPWRIAVAARHAVSPPASWPDGAHLHAGWEAKLVLRGRIPQWTTEGERILAAPSVVLIPPGAVHGATPPDELSRGDAVLCWTDDASGGSLWLGAGAPADGGHHQLMVRTEAVREQLGGHPAERLEQIATALAGGDAYARVRAEALLVVFLGALLDACMPPPSQRRPLVQRAIAIMRQAYFVQGLGVASIARQLGCTPRHLRQLFRSSGRRGMRRELIAVRLQVARKLLSEGGRSVKEVARLTGWRSPFHFSRSYRSVYGHPPSRA